MILSMSGQFYLFLFTIGIGFSTGLIYDIFRIIRRVFKHSNFLIQVEDIIYWLIVTVIMFRLMLNKNYGEIRGFLIGGVLIGMVIYFFTVSDLFLKAMMSIIHIIEQILKTIIKILLLPIKIVISILKIPLKIISPIFIKYGKKSKKVLQNSKQYVKINSRKTLKDIKIMFKKI